MVVLALLFSAPASARFQIGPHPAKAVREWQLRHRIDRFCVGRRCFAIPVPIVICESGGRYHSPSAPNGAYSLLSGPLQGVPTWETWRPRWASEYAEPFEAPAIAQDIAAHRLFQADGLAPWECAG